jgi:photosystem II stability/assembly factor-like uncharacterized protein
MAASSKHMSKASGSRVFTIEDRAGPSRTVRYQSLARAQAPSQNFGNITLVRVPDPNRYGAFKVVDSIRDAPGQPQITVQFRHTRDASEMLRLGRKGCPIDVQVHMGACKDPSDFQLGWDKILVLEGATITDYGTDDLGALDQSSEAVVNENIPFVALDMYEITRVVPSEIASVEVTQEIIDVAICDSPTCGDCGRTSDGCQRMFAMTKTSGGSPGAGARLIWTNDGGTTINYVTVSTMGASENATAIACVGNNLVITSNGGLAIHYANMDDIINGVASWTKTVVGLVAAKGPNNIFSLGRTFTWIVGDGGYVYFSSDITGGVTVQNAGVATAQVLNSIHGTDELNLVAVGAANAVIKTADGGTTWTAVTGPEVGIVLNVIVMRSEKEWMIGTASGKLWYTINGGISWTQKRFSGDGAGTVKDLVFPTPTVGYMAHNTAAPVGRAFRTIDGGSSWYTVPEDSTFTFPGATSVNAIASCSSNPNVSFAGGIKTGAVDGILIKIA